MPVAPEQLKTNPLAGSCILSKNCDQDFDTETIAAEPASGVAISCRPPSSRSPSAVCAKRRPGEAAIEALAASIQRKGLIQNVIVE